jgi:hypothetical protein
VRDSFGPIDPPSASWGFAASQWLLSASQGALLSLQCLFRCTKLATAPASSERFRQHSSDDRAVKLRAVYAAALAFAEPALGLGANQFQPKM